MSLRDSTLTARGGGPGAWRRGPPGTGRNPWSESYARRARPATVDLAAGYAGFHEGRHDAGIAHAPQAGSVGRSDDKCSASTTLAAWRQLFWPVQLTMD